MNTATMVCAVCAVCAAALPGIADSAERKRPRPITVEDRSSPAWSGIWDETVADFNAVMPRSGPRLRYVRSSGGCERPPRRRIVACSDPTLTAFAGIVDGRLIRLNDDYANENVACHELMHVLTHVRNAYGTRPDSSCVRGSLPYPGPYDVNKLRQRFRQ